MTREQLDLTGLWRFQPDKCDEGESLGYHGLDCDTTRWREVAVPAAMEDCLSGMGWYEGAGWFRRRVVVPAAWHERAFLVTSAARLGAIRLYLDFGFVPDLTAPDADRAWRQVALKLDHPALAPFRPRQA